MVDPLQASIVAVVLLIGAALGRAAAMWWRPATTRSVPDRFGPFPTVLFFGSDTCLSCVPALEALERSGVGAQRFDWASDRAEFTALGVEEVPYLVLIDRRGRVRRSVAGAPDARTLRLARRYGELHVSGE